MRLMVVEDNRTNLLVLKGVLHNLPDCEVEAYLDPLEAIERAEAELFDLLLVDFMMPGMDGRAFIARLRAQERYKHIPMVMITADGNSEVETRALKLGAIDIIRKPFVSEILLSRVRNLLAIKESFRVSEQNKVNQELLKAKEAIIRTVETDELTGVLTK